MATKNVKLAYSETEYEDAIVDFGSIIIAAGAQEVVEDFANCYPTQFQEFLDAAEQRKKGRQIPALFKP